MPRRWFCFLIASAAFAQDGNDVYQKHCASCHDQAVPRTPPREALKKLSPEGVLAALTTGTMKVQGAALTAAEARAVATFVSGRPFGKEETAQQGLCADTKAAFDPLAGPNWNGWGASLTNHRAQPAAMAGLTADQAPRLQLKWAFGFPDSFTAFAQPTIAGGRLFLGSAARKVYSLDAATGCIYWAFDSVASVRTAISIGPVGGGWAAYFGDQAAHAYAVDAVTGKLLWKIRVEDFPGAMVNGAPKLHEGRLYVPVSSAEEVIGANAKYECCKFRGSVTALNAATGKTVWKSYTIPDAPQPVRKNKSGTQLWGPSGAGVWSSPTVDVKKHALYVATGDSYSDPAARTSDAFVAFDLDTGKMLWSRQMTAGDAFNLACGSPDPNNCPESQGPDFDFGSSPILVDLPNGKRALVAGQKSGVVHAVDPDQQGEVLWQTRIGKGGAIGGIQWGQAVDEQNVYVALSDVRMEFVAGPARGANKTVFGGFAALNPKAGGGMFALRLATGERIWYTPPPGCGEKVGCSPAQSAAVTLIPGVVFSGAMDGHLRGYSTSDGRILWDVDTAHDYQTVNGVKGTGGSIDGPGPVIVGGMLYVNSGYGFIGGMPGNVLLAYSVGGK
jgi:polyvinyl alcohol dehydrogenase (cytochrome)